MIFIIIIFFSHSFANNNINIMINGNKINYDENSGYPYVDNNNRTMVPLRQTLESAVQLLDTIVKNQQL
jgi:hypothetical protein